MKIVIVGGGTAGWLAAYFIQNYQPNTHDITVIESSKIGIIGAGEGSTGLFVEVLNGGFFEKKIDIDCFIEKTDATNKMGIRHIGWSNKIDEYFAPLDVSPTGFTLNDYMFKYAYYFYGSEGMHRCSKIGSLYHNKIFDKYSALHFDGHKVGIFFKDETKNVNVIDSIIVDSELDEQGYISSVITQDNRKIKGDLFIDCSGFNKILSSSLNIKWKSSTKNLPLNTAIPFSLAPKQKNIPETKAVAMDYGWMWNIPLQTRSGCGYVFDKNFIDEDQAVLEIEKYLNKKIEPIKVINFESGYLEKFWEKNLLCLGLSSSFFEPLEATSIHNTIVQISIFVSEFLKKQKEQTFIEEYIKTYNKRITFLMELTSDFLSLHYSGGKENTEFWNFIKNDVKKSDRVNHILELCKYSVPGFSIFEGMFGSFSIPLVNWNLAGMGVIKKDYCLRDLKESNSLFLSKNAFTDFQNTYFLN